jgi:chitin-binding protein
MRPSYLLALVLFVPSAEGHGAPEYPISRQYNCYKNPQLPACRAAVAGGLEQALYDWNGVNQGAANGNHQAVVPNGAICAGGKSLYRGFDLARADWTATAWTPSADGLYEFRYHATAPHSTLYMRFYLTKTGFDPAVRPLEWGDLEQVAEVPRSQIVTTANSRYVARLNLPARTGRHVLYMIWQRADSQEAFYSCSDVTFGSVTVPNPPLPSAFSHLGQLSAQQALPAASVLKFRIFGDGGKDLETITYQVVGATTKPEQWLSQLAARVNGQSAYVRVGILQNGAVSIPEKATVMETYALPGVSQVTYQLDTVLPPTNPAPSGTWTEGSTFTLGQAITYNGSTYKCLQAHTAWRGAGWYPSAAGVIDVLWKKI